MEMKSLKTMIERFFNAELSIEEERELCCFLREHDVPAELRKDKEAVIALCGEVEEVCLPSGAEVRLEAMLDTLAQDEELYIKDERGTSKTKRRIPPVPRFLWRSAAVAATLAACYLFVSNDEELSHTGHDVNIVQVTASEQESYEFEEDTFDNPQDAMRCFKAAMGDIKIALNATEKDTREIADALNDAFLPYKKIIKINM